MTGAARLFFFWPRHEHPYLLFANRHQDRPALVGKVKVLAGPKRLASSELADLNQAGRQRQYLAWYEKPLFAENFSVDKTFDPATGQPVHDWKMFLQGADRWVQYLKANGYTGAMLMVA